MQWEVSMLPVNDYKPEELVQELWLQIPKHEKSHKSTRFGYNYLFYPTYSQIDHSIWPKSIHLTYLWPDCL